MSSATRVGVLGGTFDPIHHGHLAAAEECRIKLRLEKVLFVPAGDPPHKRGHQISPAADRLAMVEIAIASNPCFQLSRIDVERPGPSYTIGTLERLRAERGEDVELWFLMGADSLDAILTWHRPERLLELARIAAVNRPGAPPPDPGWLESALPGASQRIDVVEIPDLAISGSDLRRRVHEGRPIKYQVPEAVERYIVERGLYLGSPSPESGQVSSSPD